MELLNDLDVEKYNHNFRKSHKYYYEVAPDNLYYMILFMLAINFILFYFQIKNSSTYQNSIDFSSNKTHKFKFEYQKSSRYEDYIDVMFTLRRNMANARNVKRYLMNYSVYLYDFQPQESEVYRYSSEVTIDFGKYSTKSNAIMLHRETLSDHMNFAITFELGSELSDLCGMDFCHTVYYYIKSYMLYFMIVSNMILITSTFYLFIMSITKSDDHILMFFIFFMNLISMVSSGFLTLLYPSSDLILLLSPVFTPMLSFTQVLFIAFWFRSKLSTLRISIILVLFSLMSALQAIEGASRYSTFQSECSFISMLLNILIVVKVCTLASLSTNAISKEHHEPVLLQFTHFSLLRLLFSTLFDIHRTNSPTTLNQYMIVETTPLILITCFMNLSFSEPK